MRRRTIIAGTAALYLLASSAVAAIQLDPGEWEDTETGTENGEPVKPEVTTSCMTAEEARDVVKALTRLEDTAGQKCKTLHVQERDNTLSFDMECGDARMVRIAVTVNITFLNSRHYAGTIKSAVSYGGKTVTSDKQIDSKWIAATCRKP